MGGSNAEQEEVDTGQEQVAWLNHEAPSGPDEASGHESGVLRNRELVGGSGEVGSTCEDKTPLDIIVSEMNVFKIGSLAGLRKIRLSVGSISPS